MNEILLGFVAIFGTFSLLLLLWLALSSRKDKNNIKTYLQVKEEAKRRQELKEIAAIQEEIRTKPIAKAAAAQPPAEHKIAKAIKAAHRATKGSEDPLARVVSGMAQQLIKMEEQYRGQISANMDDDEFKRIFLDGGRDNRKRK